jgi:hypothetical protein
VGYRVSGTVGKDVPGSGVIAVDLKSSLVYAYEFLGVVRKRYGNGSGEGSQGSSSRS